MGSVTTSIKKITPAMARAMLESNTGNFRPVNQSRVRRYASDMLTGKWWLNGEAIKTNGVMLLDGQHRLHAIIMSGKTIETVVVDGLETDSAISMDKGAPRTLASWLTHSSVANAVTIAAIARQALYYERGYWGLMSVGAQGATDAEIIDYVELHNARLQSALVTARPAKRFVNASILGAAMFHAAGQRLVSDCALCVWFCDRLADGNMITDTLPVYHLRNRLMTGVAAGKQSPYVQRGLVTMAWNKTARDEVCKALQFRLNGAHPSVIPDVIEKCPAE